MTEIYIDADACPVREEVYRVAGRLGVGVFVVSNGSRPIRPPDLSYVHIVMVGEAADAADDWIAEAIAAADVCVTADIPLAGRCLCKGRARRAADRPPFTSANIGNGAAGRGSPATCASSAPPARGRPARQGRPLAVLERAR